MDGSSIVWYSHGEGIAEHQPIASDKTITKRIQLSILSELRTYSVMRIDEIVNCHFQHFDREHGYREETNGFSVITIDGWGKSRDDA